jgi:hypothetical protein
MLGRPGVKGRQRACPLAALGLVAIRRADSSARLLDQFLSRHPGDRLAIQKQRLLARPGELEVRCL